MSAGEDRKDTEGAHPSEQVVPLTGARQHSPIDRLLAEFGARVRVLVMQHCRRNQGLDPDEIEQQVRIRLWQALERDQNSPLPASYIQRVVISTVVDSLRRAAVRATEPLPEDDSGTAAMDNGSPGPDDGLAEQQRMDVLRHCLASLPERRRLAVELHLQGYTPQEMTSLVGVTLDSVRKLVERGLKDLRVKLHAYGIGNHDD